MKFWICLGIFVWGATNAQDNFQDQIKLLQTKVRNLELGYIRMNKGWITPMNGYQYKFYRVRRNFIIANAICRRLGGGLPAYGFQDMRTRRVLFNALNVTEHFWIGLRNVKTKQQNWYWIARGIAIPSPSESFFWYPSYPRDNDAYCGYIHYNDTVLAQKNKPTIHLNSLFSRNEQCSKELSFMCERVIK